MKRVRLVVYPFYKWINSERLQMLLNFKSRIWVRACLTSKPAYLPITWKQACGRQVEYLYFYFNGWWGELEGCPLNMNCVLYPQKGNSVVYGSFTRTLLLSITLYNDPKFYCHFSGIKLRKFHFTCCISFCCNDSFPLAASMSPQTLVQREPQEERGFPTWLTR